MDQKLYTNHLEILKDELIMALGRTIYGNVFFAVIGNEIVGFFHHATTKRRLAVDRVAFPEIVGDKEILHKANSTAEQGKTACLARNFIPGNNNHVARDHAFNDIVQFVHLSEHFKVNNDCNGVVVIFLDDCEIAVTAKGF